MAIELREITMSLRKIIMFSIRVSYGSARAHPYILGMLLLFLILYLVFPSVFAFLMSSSPVLVCTGIFLGMLLTYGRANNPAIEEEDKTQEFSSVKVQNVNDDVVVKKDENFSVESHVEKDIGVNERAVEYLVGEASNKSSNKIESNVLSAKLHHKGIREGNTAFTSLSLQEDAKKLHAKITAMEEREVADDDSVGRRDFSIELQSELEGKLVTDRSLAVNDQTGIEGLAVQAAKSASEDLSDSSLGSPWQPVTCDPASVSDSDGVESSFPSSSMADIIPVLDELHPLHDSEHQRHTMRATDNLEAASCKSSEHHESNVITEDKVDCKEDADKESQRKGDIDKAATTWTADDQKNLMDLGYSEEERNRRLENLIARRRLRKLKRFETQKNLIDIDSFYPSSIASITTPRHNPFDLPNESELSLDLPPIPGSAPSVLQPRQNPFDLHFNHVEELTNFSSKYLNPREFVSSAQRAMLSRRHEDSTVEPSFSGDPYQEQEASNLSPYLVGWNMDPEWRGFTASERRLTPKSDPKESTISWTGSDHVTGQKDQKGELLELNIVDKRLILSDVEGDGRLVESANAFDNKDEWNWRDVDNAWAAGFGISADIDETRQDDNAFSGIMKEIGDVEDNSHVSTGNFGIIEGRKENSSSSSEENKKIPELSFHEELANPDPKRDASIPSVQVDGSQSADLFSDSGLSENEKPPLSTIAAPDEALLYRGTQHVINNSLPSDVQAEIMGVSSSPRPVVTREIEDLASGTGELLVDSSFLSVVDENAPGLRKVTETNEQDVEDEVSGASDVTLPLVSVFPEPMAGQFMHSSSSPSLDLELSEDYSLNVDKSLQSEGANMVDNLLPVDESVTPPPEANGQGSQISVLDQPSVFENLVNINHEEPKGMNVDASDVSPRNPTHNNSIPGLHGLELTGSAEVLLEMKPEHEMGSNNDPSDSRSKITDEMLSKREEGFMNNLSKPDKEFDDEVHADVSGIKDVDEMFPSELGAVGDFELRTEVKPDQGSSRMELGESDDVLEGTSAEIQDTSNQLQDINESVISPAVAAEAKFSYSNELNPVIDQPGSIEPEVSSSLLPSGDDPELTEDNSKLHVLEACTIEELDSVFKQHHEEATIHPALELTVENSSTSIVEEGGEESKGLTEDQNEHSVTEVERLEIVPEPSHLEPEEIGSDLHIQHSKVSEKSPPNQMTHEDRHTEAEATERPSETELAHVESAEASGTHLEPEHIEVKSADEIQLDPVEADVSRQPIAEHNSEKSDGIALQGDVPRSAEGSEEEI